MIDAGAAADLIERAARDNGTPERAAGEKAYLKSDLDHLGAGMPALRRIVKDFASDHRDIGHAELTALVTELWNRPIHECRMAAIMLLEQHRRLLGERDLALIEFDDSRIADVGVRRLPGRRSRRVARRPAP